MIYNWECPECGRTLEHFEHHSLDRGAETYLCACGSSMASVASLAAIPLLWAAQGRPRTIHNLGQEPIVVRSRAEHKAAMREAGVVEAGSRRGEKGVWI